MSAQRHEHRGVWLSTERPQPAFSHLKRGPVSSRGQAKHSPAGSLPRAAGSRARMDRLFDRTADQFALRAPAMLSSTLIGAAPGERQFHTND